MIIILKSSTYSGERDPHPRSHEERRVETRRRLLEAAVRVISDVGYARCSLSVVAKAAGMTTGAIQHQFITRADLIAAVLTEQLFPLIGRESLPSQAGRPLGARCSAIIEWTWRSIYANPSYPVVWDIILGARGDPELHERIARSQREAAEIGLEEGLAAFDGLSVSRTRVSELLVLISSNLRGLALLRPFDYDEAFFDRHVAVLSRVLEHHLEFEIGTQSRSDGCK